MPYLSPSFIVLTTVLFAAPPALAQTPSPGDYETARAWGSLSISTARNGAIPFQIDTLGANAHVCSLGGKIRGDAGYADAGESEPHCFISFKVIHNGISVSAKTPAACREFCGANARFEGAYLLPPPGCKRDERAARRDLFRDAYRMEDYLRAHEMLDTFYSQCGNFLNWVEIDAVRNDLAITQYHLGHKEECLAILKNTLGATVANEETLASSLPPSDFESYLPVAKDTWYNLKLCGKDGAKSPPH